MSEFAWAIACLVVLLFGCSDPSRHPDHRLSTVDELICDGPESVVLVKRDMLRTITRPYCPGELTLAKELPDVLIFECVCVDAEDGGES